VFCLTGGAPLGVSFTFVDTSGIIPSHETSFPTFFLSLSFPNNPWWPGVDLPSTPPWLDLNPRPAAPRGRHHSFRDQPPTEDGHQKVASQRLQVNLRKRAIGHHYLDKGLETSDNNLAWEAAPRTRPWPFISRKRSTLPLRRRVGLLFFPLSRQW
jgi:hypothetical protein